MPTGSSEHNAFLATRYFSSLDGLRCVSILAVIWHHSGEHASRLASQGHLGVQLFFAISGFLITTLLLREIAAKGQISLQAFYVRRTLRIFPLYYAVLAIYVLLVVLLERQSAIGRGFFHNLPSFATYTSNWFVELGSGNRVIFYFAWSLATEEQFYLVWPSVVRFARNWYLPPLLMAGLLMLKPAAGLAVSAGLLSADALATVIIGSVATPIALGCIMAYVLHDQTGFRWAYAALGRAWSAPLAVVLLLLGIVWPACPTFFLHLAMVLLVAAVCVRPRQALAPILSNAAVRYVGMISYGMYLLHMLGMQIARKLSARCFPSTMMTFVFAAGLAILLASVSYWSYERWFVKLKDRYKERNHAKTLPANEVVRALAQPAA